MTAPVPTLMLIHGEAQPGLMDKCGGLKSVACGFVRHFLRRQFAKLTIHKRKQFVRGAALAIRHQMKDTRDLRHADLPQTA